MINPTSAGYKQKQKSQTTEFLGSLGFLLLQRYIFCRELDIRVTKVVETDVGQASGVQQGLQVAVCGTGIGGGFRLQRIWEDPL